MTAPASPEQRAQLAARAAEELGRPTILEYAIYGAIARGADGLRIQGIQNVLDYHLRMDVKACTDRLIRRGWIEQTTSGLSRDCYKICEPANGGPEH